MHGSVSHAAATYYFKLWVRGVKSRADRRGSTVHGTVSSAAVIILLLVVAVGSEETG